MKNWFNKLSPMWQVVVVVVALIIVLFIAREVKYFFNKPRVNRNQIPVVGLGTQGEVIQWDPDPLAAEISENIEGYNLQTYPETAQKILDLQTDDQVKLLYNHYNSRYAKDYPTLTKLFENEWTDWGGTYGKVVSRLKGLNLN